jgi:hypothetical protein
MRFTDPRRRQEQLGSVGPHPIQRSGGACAGSLEISVPMLMAWSTDNPKCRAGLAELRAMVRKSHCCQGGMAYSTDLTIVMRARK